MAEKRKPRAMGQLTADRPADAGPTIVGGQPPPSEKTGGKQIPVGLERVLYLAAVEPEFQQQLLHKRDRAAQERGLPLRGSEQMMLRAVPEPQLLASIAAIDTSDSNLERRGFLRAVAASAVTMAAGEALMGCSDDGQNAPTGIRPDTKPWGLDSGGIRPDDQRVGGDMGIRPGDGAQPDGAPVNDDGSVPVHDGPQVGGIRPDGRPAGFDSGGIRPD